MTELMMSNQSVVLIYNPTIKPFSLPYFIKITFLYKKDIKSSASYCF